MVLKVVTEAFVPWVTQKATRAELQRVASSIGVPVSGTKPQLTVAIQNAIDTAKEDVLQYQTASARLAAPHNCSIVSIDMGIRNLAYAHFTSRVETAKSSNSLVILTTPILQAWRRLSVGREVFDAVTDVEPDTSMDEDASLKQQPEDSFEPIDMAAHAYACGKHIISLKPTHVLIERQRFRSGGHAAVQEWSLRVGVFEGMLYATLKTFAEEGLFQGTVTPMLPARVNRYWLEDVEQNTNGSARAAKKERAATTGRVNGKEAKQAKIDLVAGILEGTDSAKSEFDIAEGAMETVNSFMDAHSGTKNRKRQPAGANQPLRKLDDLSDSLLQGLAWFEWQRNRLKLRSYSVMPITEED